MECSDLIQHATTMGYEWNNACDLLRDFQPDYGPVDLWDLCDDPNAEEYEDDVAEYGEDACKIVADFFRKHPEITGDVTIIPGHS